LLLWFCAFFLPTISNSSQDWLFPGKNPGIVAAFISFLEGVMAIAMMSHLPVRLHEIPIRLCCLLVGSLWLANFWMMAAPFLANRFRQGRGRAFLIGLWFWVLAPSSVALLPTRHDINNAKIEVGLYVWWSSFLLLALYCTALYYQSPGAQFAPYPPPPPHK
jgi:hypothetical protein